MTREEWAIAFLKRINAPLTKRNLWAIVSWCQAEGSVAAWNPLATTQDYPGATNFNSVGVKEYLTAEDGLDATARTLNYGADRNLYGYKPIRRRLRGDAWAKWTLTAVERSVWGTGGLGLRVLPQIKQYWDHYRNLEIAS